MSQSLYQRLQACTSEEDVKDEYIRALGLKGVSRNLIDIQTKEIWFEAKDGSKESIYAMFTQLLHYVQQALNEGEYVPPFLCVIDCAKAAIMRTEEVLPFLAQKTIKWGKSASNYTQEALDAVSGFIGTHFVAFRIETHEEEFIQTVKNAIKTGQIIRTQITPGNLKSVFDKWVLMIGREIKDVSEEKYNLLFFADIMSDGTVSTHSNLPAELIHRNGKPSFLMGGKLYELGNQEGYRRFWAIYDRPPKEEYRNYLLERRDSLIPLDERQFLFPVQPRCNRAAAYLPALARQKSEAALAVRLCVEVHGVRDFPVADAQDHAYLQYAQNLVRVARELAPALLLGDFRFHGYLQIIPWMMFDAICANGADSPTPTASTITGCRNPFHTAGAITRAQSVTHSTVRLQAWYTRCSLTL